MLSVCPSGGCLFAVRLAYDRISKWKIEILRPAHVLHDSSELNEANVLHRCYKLCTANLKLDRRERMGSVQKRRKAGCGTGKEATTNLKLSAYSNDMNERQLAQRSVVAYVQQT